MQRLLIDFLNALCLGFILITVFTQPKLTVIITPTMNNWAFNFFDRWLCFIDSLVLLAGIESQLSPSFHAWIA